MQRLKPQIASEAKNNNETEKDDKGGSHKRHCSKARNVMNTNLMINTNADH